MNFLLLEMAGCVVTGVTALYRTVKKHLCIYVDIIVIIYYYCIQLLLAYLP